MRKKLNKKIISVLLILLIISVSIGYALLTTTLSIEGTTTIKDNKWNIHFDNLIVDTGSVEAAEPTLTTGKTVLNYTVTLNKPGDYYTFNVDTVNEGSINAAVDIVTKTTLSDDQAKYLEYNVAYEDGTAINKYDLLDAGSSKTIKLTIKYKDDLTSSDLPNTDQVVNLSLEIVYVQADEDIDSFIERAKDGEVTSDDLGKTFEIDMGTYGTHTIRVANVTTPSECSTEGFSQTACGVVFEFVDIITTHYMNPAGTYKSKTYKYGWNVDGWPASSMYTFVNTDIYNAIPENIRNNIIDTTAVSGHATSGDNYTSIDKLYLLSTHEVWEDDDGSTSSGISWDDRAYKNTRQLDYYANQKLTSTTSTSFTLPLEDTVATKRYNGTRLSWWLRSAFSDDDASFNSVGVSGTHSMDNAKSENVGVSPAFRVA